jgi:chromosome segregation ATPase
MATEIDALRKRAEEAEADADRLHAELTSTRADVADRDRKLETLQARHDALVTSSGMQGAELAASGKKIAALGAQLVEKDGRIAALGQALEAAQAELERLRTTANEEIARLRDRLS